MLEPCQNKKLRDMLSRLFLPVQYEVKCLTLLICDTHLLVSLTLFRLSRTTKNIENSCNLFVFDYGFNLFAMHRGLGR